MDLNLKAKPLIVAMGVGIVLKAQIEDVGFAPFTKGRMQISPLIIALKHQVTLLSARFLVLEKDIGKWANHI